MAEGLESRRAGGPLDGTAPRDSMEVEGREDQNEVGRIVVSRTQLSIASGRAGSGGSQFLQDPRLHLGSVHSVENGGPTGLSDTWASTFHLLPARHKLQTLVSSAFSWPSLLDV